MTRYVTRPSSERRAFVILAIVVLCLVAYGAALTISNNRQRTSQHEFERQIIANCLLLNGAHRRFDSMLDALSSTVSKTTGLTTAQKRDALRAYSRLHLPLQDCPPPP